MGTAATAAKNKWNKENLDHYHLTMPKGKKNKYMEAAKIMGYENLSKMIVTAIEEKVKREGIDLNNI